MIPVALGILIDEASSRVLIQERPVSKTYAGYWEFPGGKIESNESSFSALQREWQEELSVWITRAEHAFTQEHVYPDRAVQLDVWRIVEYQGELVPQESQRFVWANKAELEHLDVLSGNKKILDWVKTILDKKD